jgi:AcrR family transcriptional regulator
LTIKVNDVNFEGMKVSRNEILLSARDLFLKHGTEGVTMRKVASSLEISATAIYRHYRNKDDLLSDIVDMSRDALLGHMEKALEERTARERLRMTGRAYIAFGLDHPEEYRILFMSWDRLNRQRHSTEAKRGGHARPFQFLLERIREFRGEEDLMDVAVYLWSHLHGLVSLYIAAGGREIFTPDQYRDLCHRQVDLTMKIL